VRDAAFAHTPGGCEIKVLSFVIVERVHHLRVGLNWFEQRVQAAIERAQLAGVNPTDSLRGLVITDDEIGDLLAREPLDGLWSGVVQQTTPAFVPDVPREALEPGNPFGRLVQRFGLAPLDAAILLVCLAPEMDRRYERLYAYIQDDISQRRPTVNLAMNLLGDDTDTRFAVWLRLTAHAPLRAHSLLEVLPDPAQQYPTFLAHQIKLDHRVLAFLLGDTTPDPRIRRAVRVQVPAPEAPAPLPQVGVPATMHGPLAADAMMYLRGARGYAWVQALEAHASVGVEVSEADLVELASKFKFTPTQIARAVASAADIASSRGEPMRYADLVAGAQAHSSLRLGKLAKRMYPRYTWDDLILPPDRIVQLREITARVRYAYIVNGEWGFGRRAKAAPGVTVLFAGESGTGKTLAAEILANDLGLLLYKIDLSSVVSKYIGETEKNLSAIFEEAHASNAVLFFDEADALFGKRSEVKDAHDRYANLEVAFLLQQLESYEGLAILATNLRQNLDEAFTRRLGFLIDFPFPEQEYRQHIWRAHLPEEAPVASDVNLRELAERYPLAGGNIRNAAIASAYLAAADGGMITMQHIRHAIRREHQKMGRLLDDA
jgi:hypothetical protein